MSKIEYLSQSDFEIMCRIVDGFFETISDPPPDFSQSDFAKLDMVIHAPQHTFDAEDLYPSVTLKAACYFYFINKIHPFGNGNKRMSVVSLYVFLRLNKYVLTATNEELYQLAVNVAKSTNKQEEDLSNIDKFICNNAQPAP
jgi:death-on-curing protein